METISPIPLEKRSLTTFALRGLGCALISCLALRRQGWPTVILSGMAVHALVERLLVSYELYRAKTNSRMPRLSDSPLPSLPRGVGWCFRLGSLAAVIGLGRCLRGRPMIIGGAAITLVFGTERVALGYYLQHRKRSYAAATAIDRIDGSMQDPTFAGTKEAETLAAHARLGRLRITDSPSVNAYRRLRDWLHELPPLENGANEAYGQELRWQRRRLAIELEGAPQWLADRAQAVRNRVASEDIELVIAGCTAAFAKLNSELEKPDGKTTDEIANELKKVKKTAEEQLEQLVFQAKRSARMLRLRSLIEQCEKVKKATTTALKFERERVIEDWNESLSRARKTISRLSKGEDVTKFDSVCSDLESWKDFGDDVTELHAIMEAETKSMDAWAKECYGMKFGSSWRELQTYPEFVSVWERVQRAQILFGELRTKYLRMRAGYNRFGMGEAEKVVLATWKEESRSLSERQQKLRAYAVICDHLTRTNKQQALLSEGRAARDRIEKEVKRDEVHALETLQGYVQELEQHAKELHLEKEHPSPGHSEPKIKSPPVESSIRPIPVSDAVKRTQQEQLDGLKKAIQTAEATDDQEWEPLCRERWNEILQAAKAVYQAATTESSEERLKVESANRIESASRQLQYYGKLLPLIAQSFQEVDAAAMGALEKAQAFDLTNRKIAQNPVASHRVNTLKEGLQDLSRAHATLRRGTEEVKQSKATIAISDVEAALKTWKAGHRDAPAQFALMEALCDLQDALSNPTLSDRLRQAGTRVVHDLDGLEAQADARIVLSQIEMRKLQAEQALNDGSFKNHQEAREQIHQVDGLLNALEDFDRQIDSIVGHKQQKRSSVTQKREKVFAEQMDQIREQKEIIRLARLEHEKTIHNIKKETREKWLGPVLGELRQTLKSAQELKDLSSETRDWLSKEVQEAADIVVEAENFIRFGEEEVVDLSEAKVERAQKRLGWCSGIAPLREKLCAIKRAKTPATTALANWAGTWCIGEIGKCGQVTRLWDRLKRVNQAHEAICKVAEQASRKLPKVTVGEVKEAVELWNRECDQIEGLVAQATALRALAKAYHDCSWEHQYANFASVQLKQEVNQGLQHVVTALSNDNSVTLAEIKSLTSMMTDWKEKLRNTVPMFSSRMDVRADIASKYVELQRLIGVTKSAADGIAWAGQDKEQLTSSLTSVYRAASRKLHPDKNTAVDPDSMKSANTLRDTINDLINLL